MRFWLVSALIVTSAALAALPAAAEAGPSLATSMLSPASGDLPVACEVINIGARPLRYTTRIYIVVQGEFFLDKTVSDVLQPGQASQAFASVVNAARCEFDVTKAQARAAAKLLDANYGTRVVAEAR